MPCELPHPKHVVRLRLKAYSAGFPPVSIALTSLIRISHPVLLYSEVGISGLFFPFTQHHSAFGIVCKDRKDLQGWRREIESSRVYAGWHY